MGRKKFGWKDALSLGIQAAGVVADVNSAFKAGNATNLKGAEGGVSKATLRDAQRNTGQSALVKARQNIA